MDEVAEFIETGIRSAYGNAVDWLPYETAEGGYQGTTWNTWEVIRREVSRPRDDEGELLDALGSKIEENLWCDIDPFGVNDFQFAKFSWEKFCQIVEQERRFFFIDYGNQEEFRETLSPKEMLDALVEYSKEIKLFKYLDKGTRIYRARYQKLGEKLSTAKELGPPPFEKARQTNRMSPPGIVMFYGSDKPETALRETANDPATFVVGEFQTQRQAVILDLTQLPAIPTIFEDPDYKAYGPEARKKLIFINHLADSISRPIERDEKVHISYVPTQVVTEYIREYVKWNSLPIDGIRYSSAVHPGHASYVLFAKQENLVIQDEDKANNKFTFPAKDPWIMLLGSRIYKVSKRMVEKWKMEFS